AKDAIKKTRMKLTTEDTEDTGRELMRIVSPMPDCIRPANQGSASSKYDFCDALPRSSGILRNRRLNK
ncbi:MAG: hypothetical protein ACYSPI_04270, partial [Planctomycetota bacterium]